MEGSGFVPLTKGSGSGRSKNTAFKVQPQNVRFQNVRFQNVRFQYVRNVRFTKRQVYKMLGLQNVRSSKRPVAKRPV